MGTVNGRYTIIPTRVAPAIMEMIRCREHARSDAIKRYLRWRAG